MLCGPDPDPNPQGAFFSVQGLGAMVAGPPAGEIIALLGVRVAMVGAQGSLALVCTLCALATWLPLLLVLRTLLGASLSLFQVPTRRQEATSSFTHAHAE